MSAKGVDIMSPRDKEFTERVSVFFTPEQMAYIRLEAGKLGLTVSAYVRMVVMKEVNKNA